MKGNKNYLKGIRLERKLVNSAKKAGLIAFRSAGSHSPIDVVIIDKELKRIWLIQCKKGEFDKKEVFKDDIDEYMVFWKLEHEQADLRKK